LDLIHTDAIKLKTSRISNTRRFVTIVSMGSQRFLIGRRTMTITDFSSLSKERLVSFANDLVESIEKACWVNSKNEPTLSHPTGHMRLAIYDYKNYIEDPCPCCGKSRREL
jgi:hypothetical protein